MEKSRNTDSEEEKERSENQQNKEESPENLPTGISNDMIAYVDENGNLTDTPPDPDKKKKVKAEDIVIGVPPKDEDTSPKVYTGRVEFFNDDRGYGFIRDTETQEKYFTHISRIIDKIQEGDLVTFELERGDRGMNAVDVKK